MDVFKVGSGNAPKAPDSGSVDGQKSTNRRGEGAAETSGAASTDSYASSARAREVETLVDRLIAGPDNEVRSELVDQFRALIQVAQLDTPENAARAAEALLGGDA